MSNQNSNNAKFIYDLEKLKSDFSKSNDELVNTFKEIKTGYINQNKEYKEFLKSFNESTKESSDFMQSVKTYSQSNNTNSNKQNSFLSSFIDTSDKPDEGLWGDLMSRTSTDFSKGLNQMIMGYKDFSDVLKSITSDLGQYLLKYVADTIMQMLFTQQSASSVLKSSASAFSGSDGLSKSIGVLIGGLFKHHTGGIIPSGANYSLPGTQEQLALLKGGERVLSPAENTSYNSSGTTSSPVVFNNFNVKAWDSKDVSKYFIENKEILNSITYEGIKNNNSQLRNLVRNA